MRFMILVKASKDSEAGALPDEDMIASEALERFRELGVATE
jgi:hypothetical protein